MCYFFQYIELNVSILSELNIAGGESFLYPDRFNTQGKRMGSWSMIDLGDHLSNFITLDDDDNDDDYDNRK